MSRAMLTALLAFKPIGVQVPRLSAFHVAIAESSVLTMPPDRVVEGRSAEVLEGQAPLKRARQGGRADTSSSAPRVAQDPHFDPSYTSRDSRMRDRVPLGTVGEQGKETTKIHSRRPLRLESSSFSSKDFLVQCCDCKPYLKVVTCHESVVSSDGAEVAFHAMPKKLDVAGECWHVISNGGATQSLGMTTVASSAVEFVMRLDVAGRRLQSVSSAVRFQTSRGVDGTEMVSIENQSSATEAVPYSKHRIN